MKVPSLVWSCVYYVLAYGAFSILGPLLPIFLRYLGLTAFDVGLVTGIRPFAFFLGTNVWTIMADRWQVKRCVNLFNVFAYVVVSLLLAQLSGHAVRTDHSCSAISNPDRSAETKVTVATALSPLCIAENSSSTSDTREAQFAGHSLSRIHTFGLVMGVVIVGEFFASTWGSLADLASLDHLGEKARNLFGRLRLWGSLGLGLGVIGFGFLAQTAQSSEKKSQVVNGNYPLCLYIGAGLWTVAMLVAGQFRFASHDEDKTRVGLRQSLQQLRRPSVALYLCAVLVLGWNMGLMMNFIFWYMQDLNAGQGIVGLAGFIAQTSDIVAQLLSAPLMKRLSHVSIMYIAILTYAVRHLFLSFIHNKWLVFIPQAMFGLSFGLPWSSMANFVRDESDPGTEAFMQGTLHALHWGFGAGLGAIAGGNLIHRYGARATFRVAGYSAATALLVFFVLQQLLQWHEKRQRSRSDYKRLLQHPESDGEETVTFSSQDSELRKTKSSPVTGSSPVLFPGPLGSIMQALSTQTQHATNSQNG